MSRKIITESITNKEFLDKFINFSEIALWSYTLNDNFIKGDDFLKFIDCIFNSQLTYANEAYLKFVNIKSFDLIKNKNILESSNFTQNTIKKFYHDLYLNDFRIKKYILEEEIEDHYKSIECNIFCEFNSENKLIRVNGSFIDRSNDFKAKRDLEKLNNILVDQNSYFSNKIEKLNKTKIKIEDEQEMYKGLFLESPSPIFIINPISLNIIELNKSCQNIFDLKVSNNLKLLDLIDNTNYEEFANYLQSHNGQQQTVFKGYTRSTNKELFLNIKSIKIKFDGIDALLIHITDLTEQILFHEKEIKLKEKITEIRNTLIDTQTSYKNFIDESPFGVIIVKEEEIKYVNKVSLEIIGAKHEDDILGSNIYRFIHTDYHKFVNERIEKVLNERLHTETLREKLLRINGEEFYSEIITFPTQYDGEPAVQMLFMDITEKIYQQQNLIDSEEKYRILFDSSADSILITESNGDIIECNSATLSIFNIEKVKLIENNINILLKPDTYSFLEDPFEKIKSEIYIEGRCIANRFQNEEFIANVTFRAIILNNEEKIYITIRDISTEVKALQKVNESRREAVDIVENLTVPVAISDIDTGTILYNSFKFKDVFGNNVNNENFKTFQFYKDPEDARHLRKLLKTNRKVNNFEVELINKDNKIINVLMSSSKFKFRDKEAILSSFIDITERKNYEKEIKNKDRLLEELSKTSKTGGWEYNLGDDNLIWTTQTYKIHNEKIGSLINLNNALEYYHPEDREIISDHFNNLINYSITYDLEVRIKPKNKDYIWVRTIGQALKEGNLIKRVYGTIQDIDAKKKNDLKIKEYTDTLSLATKAGNFGIFDWDIENNKLIWDNQMWRLFELDQEVIDNIYFWKEFLLIDDQKKFKEIIINSFKTKEDFEFEFRILNLKNEMKYIKSYAFIDFENEKAKRMVGVCWDNTKEKLQEIELENSLKKFETLYNNSPVMLHSIDKNGHILSVSNYWLKKLGYSRDYVIGKKSTFFLSPKSRKYAEEEILPKFFKEGFISSVNYEVLTKENEIRNVELSAISEKNEFGEFVRSLAVMIDITDRIKTEKESEFKTNRLIEFRKALDASAFVLFTSIDGKIKYANDNFSNITELPASKLHNKPIDSLINIEKSNFNINNYHNTLKSGNIWQGEINLLNKNELWLKTTSIPLIDNNNDISEILIISFDITRIIEAENNLKILNKNLEERVKDRTKELINLNKEKDNILSMVSHDLKNPLTGIILAADIVKMQSEKYQDVKLTEIGEKISRTSYKMIDIIKNLLELNAVESGKINTQFSYIDLTIILNNLVGDAKLNAEKKNQNIILENDFDEYPVYIDKKLLVQVLDNLVSNAIKFTHKEKNIFIKLVDEENYYSILIKDEGVGIPDEDLPKLFQKFSKLSPKPTDGEDSTGLGLSIVKQLVEIMNGTITVESQINLGTTFKIRFNRHQTNF